LLATRSQIEAHQSARALRRLAAPLRLLLP
jgi:hypothetical protein